MLLLMISVLLVICIKVINKFLCRFYVVLQRGISQILAIPEHKITIRTKRLGNIISQKTVGA